MPDQREPQQFPVDLDQLNEVWAQRWAQAMTEIAALRQALRILSEAAEDQADSSA